MFGGRLFIALAFAYEPILWQYRGLSIDIERAEMTPSEEDSSRWQLTVEGTAMS